METKHLDKEIERYEDMYKRTDLSKYGEGILAEYKAIKKALNIDCVVCCVNKPINSINMKEQIKEIIEDLRDQAQLEIIEDDEIYPEFNKGINGCIRREILDENFVSIYNALIKIEKIVNS